MTKEINKGGVFSIVVNSPCTFEKTGVHSGRFRFLAGGRFKCQACGGEIDGPEVLRSAAPHWAALLEDLEAKGAKVTYPELTSADFEKGMLRIEVFL